MNTEKDEQNGADKRSKIYVLSIQILFGVIIAVSFTDYHKELVPLKFDFTTAMILVGYCTVVSSLVGYSIVMKFQYHKNISRFILDIILLYFYFLLVYSPQVSFTYFLGVFPWIFGTYVVWQCFEYIEWKVKLKIRFLVSIPIFIGFIINYAYYTSLPMHTNVISRIDTLQYESVTQTEWLTLLNVFLLVVGFRVLAWKLYRKSTNSVVSK